MPRRNCAAGTAGRPSRLKTRRAFFSAPQRGGFCSSWKEGERLRPITGRRVLLLLERGGTVAPHNGAAGFAPLGRGGERLRPTFLFLSREKKKRAAPGTKKKSAGSGLAGRKLLLFPLCLCPDSGFPGAMRTGFTFCAAAADGCGYADGSYFDLIAFHALFQFRKYRI